MLIGLSLGLLVSLAGGHSRDERVVTHFYGVERWRLAVSQDAFAGATTCRLSLGKARVEGGRLIWPLGSGVDSTHAVYRIDSGAARRQSSLMLPATANMTNPSDGLVAIPVSEAAEGRVLEVRPNPASKIRRLDVKGLGRALAAAAQQGCPSL